MDTKDFRNLLISSEEIAEIFEVDIREADRIVKKVKAKIELDNGICFDNMVPKKELLKLLRIKY